MEEESRIINQTRAFALVPNNHTSKAKSIEKRKVETPVSTEKPSSNVNLDSNSTIIGNSSVSVNSTTISNSTVNTNATVSVNSTSVNTTHESVTLKHSSLAKSSRTILEALTSDSLEHVDTVLSELVETTSKILIHQDLHCSCRFGGFWKRRICSICFVS